MAPQTSGIADPADVELIQAEVQYQLETAVADALKAGGSGRKVAAGAGISTNTVQRYGLRHGWPTVEQGAGWETDRTKHDELTARILTASAMPAYLGENVDTDATPEAP